MAIIEGPFSKKRLAAESYLWIPAKGLTSTQRISDLPFDSRQRKPRPKQAKIAANSKEFVSNNMGSDYYSDTVYSDMSPYIQNWGKWYAKKG